jgi:Ca2+-binding RTX toxin-like protein
MARSHRGRTQYNSFERLEGRRLMVLSIGVTWAGGFLDIDASGFDDNFTIFADSKGVVIIDEPGGFPDWVGNGTNPQGFKVNSAAVTKLSVNLHGGHDEIHLETIDRDDFFPLLDAQGDIVVLGGDGDDVIWGTFESDWLYGEKGDDTIYGWGRHDLIYGGGGDDSLCGDWTVGEEGEDGDDTIIGDGGNTVEGAAGKDTIIGGWGTDSILGEDVVTLSGAADSIAGDYWQSTGLYGNDTVYGHFGNDVIYGGGGKDVLYGGSGNDTIHGDLIAEDAGAGRDTIEGGTGSDEIWGGGLGDTIFGDIENSTTNSGNDGDIIWGDYWSQATNEGPDSINGQHGSDLIAGQGGDDSIYGGDSVFTATVTLDGGNDTLEGWNGEDILMGQGGKDMLIGGDHNDSIRGGDGADTIWGDYGCDTLYGDAGADSILGGAGDDSGHGDTGAGGTEGPGFNKIDGGTGRDTIPPDVQDGVNIEEENCEEGFGPQMLQGGPVLLADNVLGYRDLRVALGFLSVLSDRDLHAFLQYYMPDREIETVKRWRNLFVAGNLTELAALWTTEGDCGCGDWSA